MEQYVVRTPSDEQLAEADEVYARVYDDAVRSGSQTREDTEVSLRACPA